MTETAELLDQLRRAIEAAPGGAEALAVLNAEVAASRDAADRAVLAAWGCAVDPPADIEHVVTWPVAS